jgi:hypothetical protein
VCIWFLNQRRILLSLVQLHVYFLTDVTLLFFSCQRARLIIPLIKSIIWSDGVQVY